MPPTGQDHRAALASLAQLDRAATRCQCRADIELTDNLILLQKRSDTAWARVREIQDRYGRPTAEGGWTDDAHAEWNAAWKVWGDQTDIVREAIAAWAGESGRAGSTSRAG